jgi:uncharacterized membrane protein HdeD (DUF308 family)
MQFLYIEKKYDALAFRKNWGWILAWGIALTVLGVLAISASIFTTLISVIFLGGIFTVGGCVMTINTFQYWWQKWSGFFSHLIVALVYLAFGLMLIFMPLPAALSITVLLAIVFIILGFFRIIFSATFQFPRWGWTFLSGIITLALGILILAQLPASGLYIIGLFIGIDLFIWGWAYIMLALYAKNLN